MAGQPFYLNMPRVVGIKLTGKLQPWTAAKDVILEVLRRLSVKGGVGKIMEYCGEGVLSLTVPERATITNMGAELGATTSVFPSDENTRAFLRAQDREEVFRELGPDPDCTYDEVVEINLDELEPMIACPSSPDAVKKVSEEAGTPVAQVCVGSCTNSSFLDLMTVANLLAGKTIVANTTTAENIEFLKNHGVHLMITTTPRYDGRSFGTNMMEAALTAYAGKGRPLTLDELNALIDELDLRPTVMYLNP
jgi:aconitate hydratase